MFDVICDRVRSFVRSVTRTPYLRYVYIRWQIARQSCSYKHSFLSNRLKFQIQFCLIIFTDNLWFLQILICILYIINYFNLFARDF